MEKPIISKELFQKKFADAMTNGADIAIELTVPSREATEIIIVKNANLQYKLDYYNQNYNDNLELIRCTDIKILDARLGDFSHLI